MANKSGQTVSVREAARILDRRLDVTYRLIWEGQIQARRTDGRWLVNRDSVESYLKASVRKRVA